MTDTLIDTLIDTGVANGIYRVVNLTNNRDLELIRVILDCASDDINVDGFFTKKELIAKSNEMHQGATLILVMPELPHIPTLNATSFPLMEYLLPGDLLMSTDSEIVYV